MYSTKYLSLSAAAKAATNHCNRWRFAISREHYNAVSLLELVKMSDDENPIDEDQFCVVSLAGSVGICVDGEEIDWLFLADKDMDRELPVKFSESP